MHKYFFCTLFLHEFWICDGYALIQNRRILVANMLVVDELMLAFINFVESTIMTCRIPGFLSIMVLGKSQIITLEFGLYIE